MFSLNCRPSWSCEIHGLAFKVFLNIALISFYFYTFGIASVGRYLEGSIATIKKNYDISSTDFVVKPGIGIQPYNPAIGSGWKTNNKSHLKNMTDAELRRELEKVSYQYEEIVLESRHNVSHYHFMTDRGNGFVQILQTSKEHFTSSPFTSQYFKLNPNLSYYMAFIDPTFAFVPANPGTIPRTLVSIPLNAGHIFIYLDLIFHVKLNTKSSPCRDSPGYDYGGCLKERIAQTVGCRSFWTSQTELPPCSTFWQYKRYAKEFTRLITMEKTELLRESGCQRPCQYMEYAMADSPLVAEAPNKSVVFITFSSSSVVLEKEQLAFPLESLVADVGGVLGLFIGFNFLNVGEFLIKFLRKMYIKYA